MKKVLFAVLSITITASAMAQAKNISNSATQKFMLLFRFKTDAPPPTPEQMKASGEKWGQWMGRLAQQGKLAGGEQVSYDGTTVTGTKKEVANRPVVAGNEMVTGYLFINVQDLKEAETVAKDCPILAFNGSVEIRQIQSQEN